MEAGVLLQSWPALDRGPILLPGARGPAVPRYDTNVDGCADPLADPDCSAAAVLLHPFRSETFQSEMAALSWNFLMTLVAFSAPVDPAVPGDGDFDPDDPTSTEPGQCSFAQPHYCSAVVAFLPEPGAALGAVAAFGALARLSRRRP
jgi:hypothetical protein